MSFQITHQLHDRIQLSYQNQPLFEYVYQTKMDAFDSPRPYFHPLYSLAGDLLTNFRPNDHSWHVGLSMTLTYINDQNFWGGNTYVHGQGYTPMDNVGKQVHQKWNTIECDADHFCLAHDLLWLNARDDRWIAETRTIESGLLDAEAGIWTLKFRMQYKNISGEVLRIGSPTTHGRENAGYGGLFWRGPRDFGTGQVFTSDGVTGEQVMGHSAPWLSYVGHHDGSHRHSTIVFCDQLNNIRYPNKWFLRSQPTQMVCFAFMFDEEYHFQPDETLYLSYQIIIANGRYTPDDVPVLVDRIMK